MSKHYSFSSSPWVKGLVTKEDPFHVHKTLGFLVLASYVYRLSKLGPSDMGFDNPEWTLPTVALHLLLNLSSFEFKIPQRRVTDGSRIWPEYRLHSLVFLSRSLALVTALWYYKTIEKRPLPSVVAYAIVILTMVSADVASWSVGKHHSSSVRDLKAPSLVRHWFSMMQMRATSCALFGLQRCSLYFYFAFVIQVTAFGMTLRRKNLVSHNASVVVYGVFLFLGVVAFYCERHWMTWKTVLTLVSMGNTAILLRMRPANVLPAWLDAILPRNKYLVWTAVYLYSLLLDEDTASTIFPTYNSEKVLLGLNVWAAVSTVAFLAIIRYKSTVADRPSSGKKAM